jgi:hypothetical protein
MVKPFPHRLALAGAFLFLFASACATPAAQPLSRVEALRIADAEARRYTHTGLQDYKRDPVWHAEGRWYVGYRRPGRKWVDFGIDVYDKTRKAWVLVH